MTGRGVWVGSRGAGDEWWVAVAGGDVRQGGLRQLGSGRGRG